MSSEEELELEVIPIRVGGKGCLVFKMTSNTEDCCATIEEVLVSDTLGIEYR